MGTVIDETQAKRADADQSERLADEIRRAAADRRALRIRGGQTKAFYGRTVVGDPLDVTGHRGIVAYDPAELVITARAGTPLAEVEARLAEHGQRLGFEPPRLGPAGAIGGAVATGLAGPRRPFAGAVRDFLLGARVLDGLGRSLRFGGQVFKNVAGFDAFRLMAGAQGVLGVILEVSLRVTPTPPSQASRALEIDSARARAWVAELMGRPLPLSGAFHDGERLFVRFEGGEAGVEAGVRELGGEAVDAAVWAPIRDLAHPAQTDPGPLWRLSLPQTAPIPQVGETLAWDWAGAQVWIRSRAPPEAVWRAAAEAGGHAALIRGAGDGAEVFQPLAPELLALHLRLKAAFDPARVLNPGRLYGAF